ncbi:hypothetical protein BCV71DRAFT_285116 [Rhizopus microsporus]|uniref:C2H2-type domain-containing protein n=1 Tax=Rhizopus microsporus TaxID=58291 RepID=A0A1X0SEK5_RHIZD|nr:hypothetical protein BCV71DRAFT_285116 [Rhizopus microsporus]
MTFDLPFLFLSLFFPFDSIIKQMDLQFDFLSPSTNDFNIPSTILSPLENKSDSYLTNNDIMNASNDIMEKKRYSLSSTPLKNDFYAIHHPHHTPNDKENLPLHDNHKNLKRQSPEIEVASPCTLTAERLKRMKLQSVKTPPNNQQEQHQLFSTCKGLWPGSPSLGDLSHDNITAVSNLLKVRLIQGKFKMMANMDPNDELYTLFAQDRVLPNKLRYSYKISLSPKRTKSVLSVIGNGRNLSTGKNNQAYQSLAKDLSVPSLPSITGNDLLVSPTRPQQLVQQQQPSKKKNKTPKSIQKLNRTPVKSPYSMANSPRTPAKTPNTPRKRTILDAPTVITPDGKNKAKTKTKEANVFLGKRYFLCEPCNKKYKNRNGLTYHLERCKNNGPYTKEEDELQSQQSQQSQSTVNTNISQQNDTSATPMQDVTVTTPLNDIMTTPLNESTPIAPLFEENKDEPLLEEFDLFDSINSSFDEDMLSSLQNSNLGFSPPVDELYNFF